MERRQAAQAVAEIIGESLHRLHDGNPVIVHLTSGQSLEGKAYGVSPEGFDLLRRVDGVAWWRTRLHVSQMAAITVSIDPQKEAPHARW
jgi:hypothetical protein